MSFELLVFCVSGSLKSFNFPKLLPDADNHKSIFDMLFSVGCPFEFVAKPDTLCIQESILGLAH